MVVAELVNQGLDLGLGSSSQDQVLWVTSRKTFGTFSANTPGSGTGDQDWSLSVRVLRLQRVLGHTRLAGDLIFEVAHHLVARRTPSELHDSADRYKCLFSKYECGSLTVFSKSSCRPVPYVIYIQK